MKLKLIMNSFAMGVSATTVLVCVLKQNILGVAIFTFFTIANGIYTYIYAKELKEVK